MLKFSKFCSERFHHNNDRRCRVNVVQFVGEIVRCLVDKKKQNVACLSNCRYCADRAKNLSGSAPTMYSDCYRFHPNQFTFGGVIAERVNT